MLVSPFDKWVMNPGIGAGKGLIGYKLGCDLSLTLDSRIGGHRMGEGFKLPYINNRPENSPGKSRLSLVRPE